MKYKSKGYNKSKKNKNKKKQRLTKKRYHGGYSPAPAPTLASNLNDAVALATDKVKDIISSDYVKGHINKINNVAENVVKTLKTPEGVRLTQNVNNLFKETANAIKPSIPELEKIANDGADKLTKTGTSMVVTALNELPPVFLLNELSKLGTAASQAGETVSKLTDTGAKVYERISDQRKRASELWNQGKQLYDNVSTGVNQQVATAINMAKKKNTNMLNQYRNEAVLIGGRIRDSQNEFLMPSTTP